MADVCIKACFYVYIVKFYADMSLIYTFKYVFLCSSYIVNCIHITRLPPPYYVFGSVCLSVCYSSKSNEEGSYS